MNWWYVLTLFETVFVLTVSYKEAAGLACMANKKKRITPRHVLLAVKKDEEMSTLLRAVTICGGGVLPK